MVLNRKPKDWDFATSALPHQVLPLFRKVIPTGIEHGTITILFEGFSFEVTTYRIDGEYSDSRRPNSVTFAPSILEDLSRRDFTMNAMAIDLGTGTLIDPHEGQKDISLKLIRTVGRAGDRFKEDSLRIVRAIRFSSQLGFDIEEDAKQQIRNLSENLEKVSVERFRDEFVKILESEFCFEGLTLGFELGVFDVWIPEFRTSASITNHLFACACNLKDGEVRGLQLAGLLHDIAKPLVQTEDLLGTISFPNHDGIGAEMTQAILRRLKFPNDVIFSATKLVRHHMFEPCISESPRAIRRFISRVGFEDALRLVALRRADILAKIGRLTPTVEETFILEERIKRSHNDETNAFSIGDLKIDGNILQKDIGIPKGKMIGAILKELLETVLDDPTQNDEVVLRKLSAEIYESRWKPLMRN